MHIMQCVMFFQVEADRLAESIEEQAMAINLQLSAAM
jgi:hypothetical protein